ncbi:MAG: DUF1566 domain-containing protein [Ferrovum sp.]|nr:DUF1566 domain-containing protein [Ferrovum sp.]
MQGGFFAGLIRSNGEIRALILAPKALGEKAPSIWIPDYEDVPGAKSFHDGMANTKAMAEAGSKLAKWALDLDIDGFNDYYIPALDEQEILYRAFKPTTDTNSQWARSGINLSAVEPTWPYTEDFPAQTALDDFKAGGSESFEADWYWTSTQHAADSDSAWFQYFTFGYQDSWGKGRKLRARAIRSIPLINLSI